MLKWISILWISFLTAILGEVFFFAFIDPQELYLMGKPVRWSPTAIYSVGFLMFWSLTALTAALTHCLRLPPAAIRRPMRGKASAVQHSPSA